MRGILAKLTSQEFCRRPVRMIRDYLVVTESEDFDQVSEVIRYGGDTG